GRDAELPAALAAEDRALLADPQTSGGLLVSCTPAALDAVLAVFGRHGFDQAAVVGAVAPSQGRPMLRVR
ncbi:MAG: selenide, water dikinase SelD, partial [Burkholderiales bacterium]|nr:selenide, water dikinase SelD [Burkholderiales bacterium]